MIGFAIVIAVVVFGATKSVSINNQQTRQQKQKLQPPMVTVPVDRSQLSHRLLPALPAFNSIEVESTSYSTLPDKFATGAERNQVVSQMVSSRYQRKLDDQKAWGSQPRPASLASTAKQPVRLFEKVSVAVSESPIVPGHEDPHLRYESQFLELAARLDDQQKQQLTIDDAIEFKELPELFPENTIFAPLPPNAFPRKFAPAAVVPGTAPFARPVPDPAARMARAWETGRY